METQKNNRPSKFTGFELELILSLLNNKNAKKGSIKDLRSIDNVTKTIYMCTLNKPVQPKIPALPEDQKEYPKEMVEQIQKDQDIWAKEFESYLETEVEVDLPSFALIIIADRIKNFSGYNTDFSARQKILKLAEKFGI